MATTTIFSTGIKYPQTGSQSPFGGSPQATISNFPNITGSTDNLYLTASTPTIVNPYVTPWLNTYNYGINFPTGSALGDASEVVIKGIKLYISRFSNFSSSLLDRTEDSLILLNKNTPSIDSTGGNTPGDNLAVFTAWQTSSDSSREYGGTSSLHGQSWEAQEINSPNFGVNIIPMVVNTQTSPPTVEAYIDSVGIEVFYSIVTNLGRKSYTVEFQDTNLGLQGWTNPRWDGCKLIGKEVNKYTDTSFTDSSGTVYSKDITYGLDPVVERQNTAFYFGTLVQGYEDDPIFNGFPDWSYFRIDQMLIANPDPLESTIISIYPHSFNYTAFDRIFKEDFAVGNKFKVRLLDTSIKHNIDNVKGGTTRKITGQEFVEQGYTTQFNKGRLAKVASYATASGDDFVVGYYVKGGDGNIILNSFGKGTQNPLNGNFNVYKNYSGSSPNQYVSYWTGSDSFQDTSSLDEFYLQTVNQINSGSDFYITFNSGSTGKWPNFQPGLIGKGTAKLGTVFYPSSTPPFQYIYSTPTPTSKEPNYFTSINEVEGLVTYAYTASLNNSDYQVSRLVPSNNIVLADLNKPQELPNGEGDKGFVLIPNNLKPEIRDNLDYYLVKAGLKVKGS